MPSTSRRAPVILATFASLASLAALLPACDGARGVQEELISERGGFAEAQLRLAGEDERDYCAAEVLRARYDATADLLRVSNARVMLNCCGQRSLRVERSGGPTGGTLDITLRDEPAPDTGRCEPGCAYDLAVGALAAPSSPVTVRLTREITDAPGGPALIWEGQVDPTAAPQAVVLNGAPAAPGCGTAAPERHALR